MENQLPRLTLKEIGNIIVKFFYFNKGVVYTYIQFIKQPYQTTYNYLLVNRSSVINPIRFVIFAIAIDTLISNFHPDFQQYIEESKHDNYMLFQNLELKYNLPIISAMNRAQDIFLSYQKIYVLIVIPLLSIVTYLIFKKKYNYAENLVINAYVLGVSVWTNVGITLLSFLIIPTGYAITITNLVSLLILVYVFKYIYQITWLRSVISTIVIWLVIIFISLISQLILALFILL